jgi:hypothetical protein
MELCLSSPSAVSLKYMKLFLYKPITTLIDVYHQILPSEYVSALDRTGQSRSGGTELPPWSKDAVLAMMDRQGKVIDI